MAEGRFANRVAVVTGAAGDIGYACAKWFAQEGASVVLGDVNDERGEAAANRLAVLGFNAVFSACDVSQERDAQRLIETAEKAFGAPHVSVNAAGIMHGADVLDLKSEDFGAVIQTNLTGSFHVSQAAARSMTASNIRGAIINISSVHAAIASPSQIPYAASKGGINALTRAMAVGLSDRGIRVNAVCPGSINAGLLSQSMSSEADRKAILTRIPIGRIGEPEEVAAVVAFLAHDEASYVTGQCIYVDGGRLAQNHIRLPDQDQ